MTISYGQLDQTGLATAIDWAAREGWNPGLADATAFFAADPAGYFGLWRNGALAATLSLVQYGPGFAFLGFYICRPDERGKGLGLSLWNHALAAAGADCIGLDGVVAQQPNYAKSGFVLAHRNLRYGGPAPSIDAPRHPLLVRIGPQNADEIADYEISARLFPARRTTFLQHWLANTAFAIRGSNGLRGYGVLRTCRDGHKIGPLFAETPDIAHALMTALAGEARGGKLYFDVPEPNAQAIRMAKSLDLAPMFETARMYRGPAPDLDLSRVFGITTFELG